MRLLRLDGSGRNRQLMSRRLVVMRLQLQGLRRLLRLRLGLRLRLRLRRLGLRLRLRLAVLRLMLRLRRLVLRLRLRLGLRWRRGGRARLRIGRLLRLRLRHTWVEERWVLP